MRKDGGCHMGQANPTTVIPHAIMEFPKMEFRQLQSVVCRLCPCIIRLIFYFFLPPSPTSVRYHGGKNLHSCMIFL